MEHLGIVNILTLSPNLIESLSIYLFLISISLYVHTSLNINVLDFYLSISFPSEVWYCKYVSFTAQMCLDSGVVCEEIQEKT